MKTLAFLQNINGPEILLIFLVVLLLFGAKRLPELFRSFGKSIREFKKATSEIEDDIRTAMDEEPTKTDSQRKSELTKPAESKEVSKNDSEAQTSEKPEAEKSRQS